MEFDKDLTKL